MPKLWNTSKTSRLETRFDGAVYEFLPNEKKSIYYQDIVNHLVYKLRDKGLVELPDDVKPEEEKKQYIEGTKRRRHLLKDILVQYQTVNNERVAKNQGKIEPNELEVAAVKEIKFIEEELDLIDGPSKEDRALVSDYFKKEVTEKDIADRQTEVIDDGINRPVLSNEDEPKKKTGKPQKATSLKE